MKRWKIACLLTIATLLIATVPAFASGGGPNLYWDLHEDGMEAWLIHEDINIQVHAFYAEDCYGQVYEASFKPPWHSIGWITIPEDGEGPLSYIAANVSYQTGEDGFSEPFWVDASRDCETPAPAAKVSCPTCGSPVWESANGPQGDGMAMVWYSPSKCEVFDLGGCYEVKLDSRVRAWSTISFFFEAPAGELHEAEMIVGADGVTYYVLDVDDSIGNNAILRGPEGEGDKFRDHGPVYKYSACSVAPGYYDTPDDVAIFKGGHTISDWALFLLNNGYYPDEEYRGDAALEWADMLSDSGELALP